MFEFWENQYMIKALYAKFIEPVCKDVCLTRTEMDILLFLANHPQYDTAVQIIEERHLTKSHVSLSLNNLLKKGYLSKYYKPDNKKTAHLKICECAFLPIEQGRKAQREFVRRLCEGLSEDELESMANVFNQMMGNIRKCLQEDEK